MEFGAHAFVWVGDWAPASAQKAVAGAAAAGLDFLEIPLLRPEEFSPEETRRMLSDHGIGATFSLGLPAEAALPERPREAEDFLLRALDQVAATGSDRLTGVVYGSLGLLPGRPPTETDYETVAAVLRRVAAAAGDRGIRLGIEPVNRYETFLVNTTAQGLALLDRIGAANSFLHLDTYHMNIEEESFGQPIREAGDRLGYIHLSESHRGTPGSGTVDWDNTFRALAAIDYQGALVLESFVALHPDIARATCMWRDVVGNPATLVRDGLAFLHEKAAAAGLLR